MWPQLHFDSATVLQMLKGGLPPVIVISMYQASSVANIEFTVGYLAAILAVSAQCLMPRAKFMKLLFFSVLSICGGAALSCLVVFCAVRARQHTTPADASLAVKEGYNSSASAVSAIWLLFSIWFANSFRALRPMELQDPMVALSIFSVVTMTQTPSFVTISEGLDSVRRLLVTFLIGLAVAAGVSLFILPITSRRNIYKALSDYPDALKKSFKAQIAFVQEEKTRNWAKDSQKHETGTLPSDCNSNTEAVASNLSALRGLQSKLNAELTYTKLEIAWGKLLPRDLEHIYDHLQMLFIPLSGLSMFPEVSRELLEDLSKNLSKSASTEDIDGQIPQESSQEASWEGLMTGLEERLASTCELVITGVRLAFEMLEIKVQYSMLRKAKGGADMEKQESEPEPTKRSEIFHQKLLRYKDRRQHIHKKWPALMFPATSDHLAPTKAEDGARRHDVREHVLVFLFMEHVQNEVLEAVCGLLNFAEAKVKDGSMRRNKFILPGYDQIKRMEFLKFDSPERTGWDGSIAADADHLPPVNFFERSGNHLRLIPKILTSPESVFGFRVTLASFTVAIMAYLRQTHEFFDAQRLIWAMIVIVIGMKPESGASIFGYFARVAGTVVAMILSLIAWYIVDGRTPGVLIFLYFANVFLYYFWVRFPQHLGPCTISIVTLNVIIAYELQVKKLGIERATSNGQPYYSIYLFGPYKLLCVLAGVTISFFWTIFPYPVSARSRVRKTLGRCLFLLANFYSCTHSSIKLWINEQQGDMSDLKSPGSQLQASSRSIFSKQIALLAQTQSLIHWTAYEPPVGGKFPQAIYQSAVSDIQMLATCIVLMSHTTRKLDFDTPAKSESKREEKWIHQLALATRSPEFDSHTTASLLCHLAAAISNKTALPPYLAPTAHFPLARKLREINARAMDLANIQDPEFSAFACMEVATSLMSSRLTHLIKNVKGLVGEINFDNLTQDGTGKREKVT